MKEPVVHLHALRTLIKATVIRCNLQLREAKVFKYTPIVKKRVDEVRQLIEALNGLEDPDSPDQYVGDTEGVLKIKEELADLIGIYEKMGIEL